MRIAIVLNEHGEPAEFAADEDIEVLTIDPSGPSDRVFRYGGANVGAEHVDALIGDDPIGHIDDGRLILNPV